MTKKTKIEKLFDKRSATYQKNTTAILDSIQGVIDGIELYAREEDLLNDDTKLEIIAATYDTETQFVFMVGIFKPNIGTSVMMASGEQFEIETEEDQSVAGKILRINISSDMIEQNDAQITLAYIQESTAKLQELTAALAATELLESNEAVSTEAPTTLSEEDRKDQEKLAKMLEGATNPSGMFN